MSTEYYYNTSSVSLVADDTTSTTGSSSTTTATSSTKNGLLQASNVYVQKAFSSYVESYDPTFYSHVLLPSFLVIIVPACYVVIKYYAAPYPQTTWSIRLLTFLTLFLGFSGVLLLPLDLTLTLRSASSAYNASYQQNQQEEEEEDYYNNDDTNNNDEEEESSSTAATASPSSSSSFSTSSYNATYVPWMMTYWCSFALAFVVLPMTRKSLQSGYFTLRERWMDAIHNSIKTWLIMLLLLVVALVFLAVELHNSLANILPLLMAVGNTYGLLLVALLLGYGLVDVPRQLWRHGNPQQDLRRCYILANAYDEALFEAVWHLQDLEDEIDRVLEPVVGTNISSSSGSSTTSTPSTSAPPPQDVVTAGGGGGSNNRGRRRRYHYDPPQHDDLNYHDAVHQLLERRNTSGFYNSELLSRRTQHNNNSNRKKTSSVKKQRSSLMLADDDDGDNDHLHEEYSSQHLPSIDTLAFLNKRLKASQANLLQKEQAWHDLVESSRRYQAMMDRDYSYFCSNGPSSNGALQHEDGSSSLTLSSGGATNSHTKTGGNTNSSSNRRRGSSSLDAGGDSFSVVMTTPSSYYHGNNVTIQRICYSFEHYHNKIRFYWFTQWIAPCSRMAALISTGMSIMVLWCETTMAIPYNLSPFGLLLGLFSSWQPPQQEEQSLDMNDNEAEEFNNYYASEEQGYEDDGSSSFSTWQRLVFAFTALVPLLYMSVCVYSSLFKISFFGPYQLQSNRQSSNVALIFNAQYLVRMQFPLGYNYLMMLKFRGGGTDEDGNPITTSFAAIMRHMSTVPFLGTSFSVYAPLLICGLCGFTLCNGYPKLLTLLGLEHEDALLQNPDKEEVAMKEREGQLLLRRYAERSMTTTTASAAATSSIGAAASSTSSSSSKHNATSSYKSNNSSGSTGRGILGRGRNTNAADRGTGMNPEETKALSPKNRYTNESSSDNGRSSNRAASPSSLQPLELGLDSSTTDDSNDIIMSSSAAGNNNQSSSPYPILAVQKWWNGLV